MTNTGFRKRNKGLGTFAEGDVLTLSVHGTLDTTRNGIRFYIERTNCPCCGHKTGTYRLNARGKRLLKLKLAQRKETEIMQNNMTAFLKFGEGTGGPFLTVSAPYKHEGADRYTILFEGRWRMVHAQVKRLYINYSGEKITVLLEGNPL